MQKMRISQLILGLIIMVFSFPLCATQSPKDPSAETLKNLNELKPTLDQIRKVDPNKVPWGLNLCLLEERGQNARDKTLDKFDFSSRVTLYQKHKAVDQEFSNRKTTLTDEIARISEEVVRKEEEVKKMIAEVNQLSEKINTNKIHMKNFADSIRTKIGLTDNQINALPDIEKWKEMRKTQCVTTGNLRPLPTLPKEKKTSTSQTVPWKRAEIPTN